MKARHESRAFPAASAGTLARGSSAVSGDRRPYFSSPKRARVAAGLIKDEVKHLKRCCLLFRGGCRTATFALGLRTFDILTTQAGNRWIGRKCFRVVRLFGLRLLRSRHWASLLPVCGPDNVFTRGLWRICGWLLDAAGWRHSIRPHRRQLESRASVVAISAGDGGTDLSDRHPS